MVNALGRSSTSHGYGWHPPCALDSLQLCETLNLSHFHKFHNLLASLCSSAQCSEEFKGLSLAKFSPRFYFPFQLLLIILLALLLTIGLCVCVLVVVVGHFEISEIILIYLLIVKSILLVYQVEAYALFIFQHDIYSISICDNFGIIYVILLICFRFISHFNFCQLDGRKQMSHFFKFVFLR